MTFYRAKWTQAKREAYHNEHPENFAGPDMSYPIEDAGDVEDAWDLAGHADSPDSVRSKIKSIAKRLHLESGLPETAKEKEENRMTRGKLVRSVDGSDVVLRADGSHDPMTGTHAHGHPSYDGGANVDGGSHEHEHWHNSDANHSHRHDGEPSVIPPGSEADADDGHGAANRDYVQEAKLGHTERSAPTAKSVPNIYMAFARIDEDKREVIGACTTESLDNHKTIIGFDASKQAFGRWIGNIREMHQPKAVGTAITWDADDARKQIILRAYISRSADGENTWTKIQEGILKGFSVAGTDPKWTTVQRDGKTVPYLEEYNLSEVSLVDNPSNKDCWFEIARADGSVTDVVASDEEVAGAKPAEKSAPSVERAGARLSAASQASMHNVRDHALMGARAAMDTCHCDECGQAMAILDPDLDGDIDILGSLDTDGDMAGGENAAGGDGLLESKLSSLTAERMVRMAEKQVEELLQPIYARMQAVLGEFSRMQFGTTNQDPDGVQRLAQFESKIDKVLASIEQVGGRVERIEKSPASKGPILNAAYAADKRLGGQGNQRTEDDVKREFAQELQRDGQLQNLDDQVRMASKFIRPMR